MKALWLADTNIKGIGIQMEEDVGPCETAEGLGSNWRLSYLSLPNCWAHSESASWFSWQPGSSLTSASQQLLCHEMTEGEVWGPQAAAQLKVCKVHHRVSTAPMPGAWSPRPLLSACCVHPPPAPLRPRGPRAQLSVRSSRAGATLLKTAPRGELAGTAGREAPHCSSG